MYHCAYSSEVKINMNPVRQENENLPTFAKDIVMLIFRVVSFISYNCFHSVSL